MTNKTAKQPTVTLTLTPGPVTPAQKQARKRFWKMLRAQVQNEVNQ